MILTPYNYLYLRPSRNILRGGTVTSTAGTPQTADHPLSWLTDDRPAYPARWAAGAWGASVAAAGDVQLVVVANHSMSGNITVGGGANGTIVAPASVNGIYRNPFLLLETEVTVSAVTLSGTNAGPTLIGEVFAGEPEELPPWQLDSYWEEYLDGPETSIEGDQLNIPPHDEGLEYRRFGGQQIYTAAQKLQVENWYSDQRRGSRPSVLVLNQAGADARVVLLEKPRFTSIAGKDTYMGVISFIEFPRFRW